MPDKLLSIKACKLIQSTVRKQSNCSSTIHSYQFQHKTEHKHLRIGLGVECGLVDNNHAEQWKHRKRHLLRVKTGTYLGRQYGKSPGNEKY